MNLPSFRRSASLFALTSALTSALTVGFSAHAVVLDGHIQLSSITNSNYHRLDGANLSLSIDQTPEGDWTGVWFVHQLGYIKEVTYNTDEGSLWFLVKPGELISAEMVAPGSTAKRIQLGYNPKVALKNQSPLKVGNDFYLAGLTRKTYAEYTIFGWAHIRKDIFGRFKLLDSAVAYGEPGLLAGTRLSATPAP
jgi:hypothetical protein